MNREEKLENHSLLIKFFSGDISDDEIGLLKAWLESDPRNQRIFDEENELWQEAGIQTRPNLYNTDAAWMSMSTDLGFGRDKKTIKILSTNKFRMLIAAATVACLLAIGGTGLWIVEKKSLQQVVAPSMRVSTNEGEKAHIFLSDSTEIILNSGSMIQYDGLYNVKDRRVKLCGEAFFDVRTNPEKPFLVELDRMSVSATGTRFNIFSFNNEDRIETTLEEGKIEVLIKGKEPINVRSGQQVVYFVRSDKVLVHEVVTDTYLSWKENKLRFYDTPLEEVLRRLGRKYNVKFEIENRDLLNLKYTATFIDESIEQVMQMLKEISPITYKIYKRASVNDKQYLKPRIVVGKRKT
jgi:transmembrane sensor